MRETFQFDELLVAWFCFSLYEKIMVVPFIALVVLIIVVVYFLAKAGKKKSEGKDLGEPGKGTI